MDGSVACDSSQPVPWTTESSVAWVKPAAQGTEIIGESIEPSEPFENTCWDVILTQIIMGEEAILRGDHLQVFCVHDLGPREEGKTSKVPMVFLATMGHVLDCRVQPAQ
jgi:hypothetical protein